MTFYHYIEEMNKVTYRYHKQFLGSYVDLNGIIEDRTYSLYVRDLDAGVETWLHPCEKMLWENSFYKGDFQNCDSGLRSIRCSAMFDFVTSIIQCGAKGVLYKCNLDRSKT